MKTSKELKMEAKAVLRGRWGQAVLLNLVPTLIAIIFALIILVPVITLVFVTDGGSSTSTMADQASNSAASSGGGIISSVISALFMSGISWTYLDLLRGTRDRIAPFYDAFRAFNGLFLGGVILLAVVTAIFISLWTLLLIIPGIVKGYSYAQSYFIYYDHLNATGEKLKILDTITTSRRLMDGSKGRLFWLDLSFIGWHILATMTAGIGYLWLNPYISATKAAFYKDLAETRMS